tara:strand:+ start:1387 stop:1539 length:153 start_codon:yes stop_codon:yes gene_type:complete
MHQKISKQTYQNPTEYAHNQFKDQFIIRLSVQTGDARQFGHSADFRGQSH